MHGRLVWEPPLSGTRDAEPATLLTAGGLRVRAAAVPRGPSSAALSGDDRSCSAIPMRRRQRCSYRHVPRSSPGRPRRGASAPRPTDLYDLWGLAQLGAVDRQAAEPDVRLGPTGAPPGEYVFHSRLPPRRGTRSCKRRHECAGAGRGATGGRSRLAVGHWYLTTRLAGTPGLDGGAKADVGGWVAPDPKLRGMRPSSSRCRYGHGTEKPSERESDRPTATATKRPGAPPRERAERVMRASAADKSPVPPGPRPARGGLEHVCARAGRLARPRC